MSLRARVVALIGLVLLLATVVGALVVGSQSRLALHAELASGLAGGRATVGNALEDLSHSDHPDRDISQLADSFNGNRHVRATLFDAAGRPVRVSQTEEVDRFAPTWFQRLLGPTPPPLSVALPPVVKAYRAIVLSPIPELDAAVAWRQFVGVIVVLVMLATAWIGLVYLLIGAALRPLTVLAAQFDRIGRGDYSGRVAETGQPELIGLERGFNRMAAELAATTARNRLLADQLTTIQDEERADIARDLHDEFGPHLFAINMDAEMIVKLGEAGRAAAIPEQARLIQLAVGRMQRQVRDLLGRLRPTRVTELGLNAAIADMTRFWRVRRPDIRFEVTALEDEGRLSEAAKEVVYRVVQEAANNAMRHGAPSQVSIVLAIDAAAVLTVTVSNDGKPPGGGGGQVSGGQVSGGLGLVGMRERVAALGGQLTFGPDPGEGWTTRARIPLDPASTNLAMSS